MGYNKNGRSDYIHLATILTYTFAKLIHVTVFPFAYVKQSTIRKTKPMIREMALLLADDNYKTKPLIRKMALLLSLFHVVANMLQMLKLIGASSQTFRSPGFCERPLYTPEAFPTRVRSFKDGFLLSRIYFFVDFSRLLVVQKGGIFLARGKNHKGCSCIINHLIVCPLLSFFFFANLM